jgi:hypothetical protein
MDSFLRKCLHVLEMACHLFLEIMLRISDIDLILHLTSDLVDNDRNSANSSILAFARTSGISAVIIVHLEVH